MDISAMTVSVVAALTPYLTKAGGKLVEKAGDAAWTGGEKIYAALKKRFAGSAAEPVLAKLATAPEDADRQGALRAELKDLLAADPVFARELAALMPPVAATSGLHFDNKIGEVGTLAQGQNVTVNNQR